uniref:UDP-glucose/GDP-mannose dehydrogenase dimerisation domain-containing protein n=1 Tax=viral metagenome TaxID=1070528 RepID=A0A6C0EU84_9ZZZZ
MNVGIIGKGMVGNAIYEGLKTVGNIVSYYDPKHNESKFTDILNTDCVFICVPTLPDNNNECDISILCDVLEQLNNHKYSGIICIKSTVVPGTTYSMIQKYNNNNICFCPEFLKERCAYEDFVCNKICLIGSISENAFDVIKKIHNTICTNYKNVHPTEAELTKYMQNVFNTYKILFANGFYEICEYNNVNYSSVLETLVERGEMENKYMLCNDKLRGPSGPCLVKDSLAFNTYVNKLNLPIKPTIFQTIVNDMKLYPKTVIEGTRSEIEYFGKNIL